MPAEAVPRPPSDLLASRMRDPYPYFAWLRRHAPAYVERRPGRAAVWQVSRYQDVRALPADPRLSKHPGMVPGYVPGPAGSTDTWSTPTPRPTPGCGPWSAPRSCPAGSPCRNPSSQGWRTASWTGSNTKRTST
ncbi:hypothetical protein QMZ92_30410 [Streptomyces sp. HNM0645]|nr:hypothetical protein [Streptomyces sp. HNM0645]